MTRPGRDPHTTGHSGVGDPTGAPRLRVLWIYHSGVVSAWRQGRVRALAAEGVEVTVVSAPRWNEGGAVVELAPAPDEAVHAAATLGTHPFLFVYDPRPLYRLLREDRFDVIDAHEEPASTALFEILTLARRAGSTTPVVCYSAQNIFKIYPPPFRWFERQALEKVAAVHTCSWEVEGVLRAKGFAGEVVNLGLGVDVDHFAPGRGRAGAGHGGALAVGYVGRLEERKGIFTLLGAVEATDGVEVTFVGDGPDRDRLQHAIDARQLGERATVSGFVDHDALPGLYRTFDVVVAHSIDTPAWREQFGRVVVEAMASGVPVVVSDAGSLAEVAGDAAVVTPQCQSGPLAEALAGLRDDPDRRAELRVRGLERATDFSWENIAKAQAAMYDRVAHGAVVPSGAGA